MVLFIFKKHCWLNAAAVGVMLASASHAQPGPTTPAAASQASFPAPATPTPASEKSVARPSAFDGYKPYTDESLGNWKAANDNVAQIGGWREYAKQAQQPDNIPVAAGKAVEPISKPITKAKP